MRTWRTIGLISGTSMDAIDVAATELSLDGPVAWLRPLGHEAVPYPEWLREQLRAALPPGNCTAEHLCMLDNEVGRCFARAADRGMRLFPRRPPAGRGREDGGTSPEGTADLVSSLGQTLYHRIVDGRCRGTTQLGQPAWIAEATGLPVISDLRARDVAAGGHGAPLAGLLDALWLAGLDDAVSGTAVPVALNIGGIANITVPGPDGKVLAYDTGPGNALLDAACELLSRGNSRQDTGGALASRGHVRGDLLDVLLADPYYATEPPKSTGKERFNAEYLTAALDGLPEVDGADLLATLVELTARTVASACRAHGAGTVVAAGGGVHNPALAAALRAHLDLGSSTLRTSDELGLPVDGKEAHLSALLGLFAWHGIPANLPSATGARGQRILGNITPGRGPLDMPPPGTVRAPQQLRVLDPNDDHPTREDQ